MINRRYGWIPDLPDCRDLQYKIVKKKYPAKVDLVDPRIPIFDQGDLGSCVGNGVASVHLFAQLTQKKSAPFVPSRLFIYYNARVMKNTVNEDSGAYIRDGIKSIAKQGVCDENEWKYIISKFKTKPPVSCYKNALDNQALKYERLDGSMDSIKACLSSGFPFVCGFSVYESFESRVVAKTGVVPMPGRRERMRGGHCVWCCGYDDGAKRVKLQNSWGKTHGDHGFIYLPYDYIGSRSLADDFWKLELVE